MTDPTSMPSFPEPPAPPPLQQQVLEVLTAGGAEAELDERGNVAVKIRDQKLLVRCVDGPPTLVRVFGQWRIGDAVPADEVVRLRAINEVTSKIAVVKVTVHDDVLVVAADHVMIDRDQLGPLLRNSFQGVLKAVQSWHEAAAKEAAAVREATEKRPEDDHSSHGGVG